MNESTLSARELAKKIPGTVSFVGFLRAQRKAMAEILASLYLSRLKRFFWRAVHFDSLKAPLVVSNHPRENYLAYTSDKVIGKLLYCRGDFDFHKFERAMRILNLETKKEATVSKPVLFDIGANIGPIGIPAIKRGYVDKVIAFEPDPDNYRLLRINAILNDVDDRMECYQVGLGAETGKAKLTKSVHNFGDHRIQTPSSTAINTDHDESDSLTIEVRKLDDFLTDATDYILWIDVQGYESHVLSGALAALRNAYPLVLEFVPKDLAENGTLDKFLEQLTTSSYTRFFDLNCVTPVSVDLNRESILELGAALQKQDSFTDILFL